MRKVFISHATSDKPLADLVQDLIETGIGIQHHEVFCTSLEGLGIPEGTDFKEHIRTQLDGCDTVIALISENYYASAFCMCELGAVWILATKKFFPILVPPVDFGDLRGALTGVQCRKLTESTTPSALYDHLSKLTDNPVPIVRWDLKRATFLKALPKVLAKLPKPHTVKADDYARVLAESEGYKEAGVQLQEENEVLKEQIKELSKAKDANAVKAIQKKYSTDDQQYQTLLGDCSKTFSSLPVVVREALFYWTRNEAFVPDYEAWGDDVKKAIENDELREDGYSDRAFWPHEDRPKIKRAMDAIKALRKFLDGGCSEQFYERLTQELGDTPDLTRRDYWKEVV